jgi:hypothetical protein
MTDPNPSGEIDWAAAARRVHQRNVQTLHDAMGDPSLLDERERAFLSRVAYHGGTAELASILHKLRDQAQPNPEPDTSTDHQPTTGELPQLLAELTASPLWTVHVKQPGQQPRTHGLFTRIEQATEWAEACSTRHPLALATVCPIGPALH